MISNYIDDGIHLLTNCGRIYVLASDGISARIFKRY